MVRKITIAIAIVIIITCGALAYYIVNKPQTAPQTKQPTTTTTTEQSSPKALTDFAGTVTDLMDTSAPIKCTFSTGNGGSFSGTAYATDGKVRQDMELAQDSDTLETHIIIDNNTAYVWSSLDPNNGTKITIETTGGTTEASQEAQSQELQGIYNYKCSSWQVDNSKFALPNNIEFTDASNVRGQTTSANDDMLPTTNTQEQKSNLPEEITDNMEKLRDHLCASCANTADPEDCRKTLGCD